MIRYIAFLRAINVGGHTVKMDRLRALVAELGFAKVETFIASGNVIFETDTSDTCTLEKAMERHLQQSLGYPVATFIRSPAEVAAAARFESFASEPSSPAHVQYIAFLPTQPGDAAAEKVMSYRSAIDEFHVHGREVYWLCRTSMHESRFSAALLEKILGMPATLRNVTTVRKLAAKYAAE